MSFLISIVILFVLVSPLKSIALSIPRFEPNVIDNENILKSSEKNEINDYINHIRKNADILTAVYILKSLNGESIEDYSAKAFKKWQLGEKGKDNGLLLVIALNDRKSRIEIGNGLEGDLPDMITKQALVEKFRP